MLSFLETLTSTLHTLLSPLGKVCVTKLRGHLLLFSRLSLRSTMFLGLRYGLSEGRVSVYLKVCGLVLNMSLSVFEVVIYFKFSKRSRRYVDFLCKKSGMCEPDEAVRFCGYWNESSINNNCFWLPFKYVSGGQWSVGLLCPVIWETTPRGLELCWCYLADRLIFIQFFFCAIFDRWCQIVVFFHLLKYSITLVVSLLVKDRFSAVSWWVTVGLVTTKSVFHLEDVWGWLKDE